MTVSPGLVALAVLAFALGAGVTWASRAIAVATGIVNHPNPIVPQHTRPIAYLGGIAIAVALAVVAVIVGRFARIDPLWLADSRVAIPACMFVVGGTIDDLRPFAPLPKLAFQAAAAAAAVLLGLVWDLTGIAWLDASITVVWFLTLVNAFNLVDVCDGLLAGLAAIALVFLFFASENDASTLLVAGVVLGFLIFNFPNASIFLGDGGSHLLGFLIAALAILVQPATWTHAVESILVVGVPLFELVFLTVVRARKGMPFWRGSPDHFSLRLQSAGLTKRRTDLVAWTAAVVLCIAAATLEAIPSAGRVVVIAPVLVAMLLAARLLRRWEAVRP